MDIAIALLQRYSFDLGGYTIRDLQKAWGRFKPEWPRQATIEALFQGRYKAVSVNQILELWERKGEPQHRYNREFERLVCDDVAVNYEDRIFYKSPPARTEPLTAISPLSLSPPQSQSPARSLVSYSQYTSKYNSQYNKLQSMSGTTMQLGAASNSLKMNSDRDVLRNGAESSLSDDSSAYVAAYANMALLAEGSIFVDKLRSMCSDRPIIIEPEPVTPNHTSVGAVL